MRINFENILIIRHPIAMMLACFLFGGLAIAFAGSKRITYSDMMRERVERLVGYDLPDDLNPSSQERRRRTPLLDQMMGYMFHPGDSLIEELMDTCEERGGEILDRAAAHGLLLLQAGPDVLRFVPALTLTDAELADGLARLRLAIAEYLAQS